MSLSPLRRPPRPTPFPYTTLFRSQAGGATDEAVRLMREAAALEDRMPAEFGPPADVKPAHELFGEMLLEAGRAAEAQREFARDRKSTRLNSSHQIISYAVFCLKKK